MMFPPSCFTVSMVFFGCNSAFFLLQTRQVEFLPKSCILVSSAHMTFFQSSNGSSKCFYQTSDGLDISCLKQGDMSGTAGFEFLLKKKLQDVRLADCEDLNLNSTSSTCFISCFLVRTCARSSNCHFCFLGQTDPKSTER
ncbi:hypothetical protein NQD34_018522 [Periophthalmus magnuspinnatus]|nr:hypothetical protein NQD34_018522 [Periophthalmus magnuspinnatus]